MWLPSDPANFYHRFQWVETGRYVFELQRLIRDQTGHKGNRVPVFTNVNDLEHWRNEHKNVGLYTSVLQYDYADITSQCLSNLYFDLDNKNVSVSLIECVKMVAYLRRFIPDEALRIYFTGEKGFHVEAEAVALGITPDVDLPNLYRFIANSIKERLSLTSMDFAVYDSRRMWRLANSQHQSSAGLFKIPLTHTELDYGMDHIKRLAKTPRHMSIPDQQFNITANEWYRGLCSAYQDEQDQLLQERIALFNRFGTGLIGKSSDLDVRKHCNKALQDLQNSEAGFRNNLLNKTAFIFYNYVAKGHLEESWVTNQLTDVALAIGLTEHETRATLDSARKGTVKLRKV